jgi:hypothetical protein
MLSVNGIFDGLNIKFVGEVPVKKPHKVIVTFVEEIDQVESDLRNFSAQTHGLDFWEVKEEDLYQDYLKSKDDKK